MEMGYMNKDNYNQATVTCGILVTAVHTIVLSHIHCFCQF